MAKAKPPRQLLEAQNPILKTDVRNTGLFLFCPILVQAPSQVPDPRPDATGKFIACPGDGWKHPPTPLPVRRGKCDFAKCLCGMQVFWGASGMDPRHSTGQVKSALPIKLGKKAHYTRCACACRIQLGAGWVPSNGYTLQHMQAAGAVFLIY